MRKTKLPNIVTILILTMITTVMWVGFSIYHAFTQAPPAAVPSDVSQTLNPSLDTNTIGKVESAVYFDPSQIPAITLATPSAPPGLTQLIIRTPIASASATPTASPILSPTASPSASATP